MKDPTRVWKIIAIKAVIILGLAGCATTVPIKSVRQPTINGMDTVRKLVISGFQDKSGGNSQVANFLSNTAKDRIQATGRFTILVANDPNADGVFFGELRSVKSNDTQRQGQRKDQNGNTENYIIYTREVSVAFAYGVRTSRAELGTVTKEGRSSSSSEDSSKIQSVQSLAEAIIRSQLRSLEQDLLPTTVTTKQKLTKETSKDKTVKQMTKTAQSLIKNGNLEEAVKVYDEIGEKYGSVAAKANANMIRQAIQSDVDARNQMAQLESQRSGLTEKAVKSAVEELNGKLSHDTAIMLMITSNAERNLINDVLDQITTAVVQEGKLRVIDRTNQALINAEQEFQLSGNVDDNSAVSIGHQLGVRYAVLCWISGTASSRKLNLRVLDIETAQIAIQTNFEI